MFDVWEYLPCPSGVVALRGVQNQGFDFFEVEIYYSKSTFDTVFPTIIYSESTFDMVAWSPSTVRLVVIACGASATSEKTCPWNFVAYILWVLSIFVGFRVSQVVPAQNDADDGDEPTRAVPHSHRQANTHRDQISRSGETPHSDICLL